MVPLLLYKAKYRFKDIEEFDINIKNIIHLNNKKHLFVIITKQKEKNYMNYVRVNKT